MDSDAELDGNFDSWLKQLLDSHSVDGEVFGEYISGTLRTIENPTEDEITESLSDVLSGCVEDETACMTMTAAITEKWMTETARRRAKADRERELKQLSEAADHEKATVSQVKDVPSQKQASAELGGLSEAEKKRLVAQYDCESDGNSDVDEGEAAKETGGKSTGTTSIQGLFQNVNAKQVVEAERQKKRDQKAAHEAKLERDRKSREAQKQKAQDRKEKEKKRTQKQEKRR